MLRHRIGSVLTVLFVLLLSNVPAFAKKPPGHHGHGHRGHYNNHGNYGNGGHHHVNVGPGGISYGYHSRNFGIVIGPSLGGFVDPYLDAAPGRYRSTGSYFVHDDIAAPPPLLPVNEPVVGYQQQAENAFRQQQYLDAVRLAKHALIEDYRNGRLHLFLSQAQLAIGDYSGSAESIRRALPLLKRHQWGFIVENQHNYYVSQQLYAAQLNRLTTFIDSNPNHADAHFVRGYQNLFLGRERAARSDLEIVSKIDGQDSFAQELLRMIRSEPASNHEELPMPTKRPGSRRSY